MQIKEDFAFLEKEGSVLRRGWFESIFFWPKTVYQKITAEQSKFIPELENDPMPLALAKVKIVEDGKIVFKDDVPWPMMPGKVMLLLQVYTLSQMPDYRFATWQKTLEAFCLSFEEFEKPSKLYWSKKHLL